MPACVFLSIVGQLRKRTCKRAACVNREWRGSVETAKGLGMYDVKLLSVVAGGPTTVVCTVKGDLFTFGSGDYGMLGHGGEGDEEVPRLVEALVGKKVVGVSKGAYHTAVWTETGELFTCGYGGNGRLGHGGKNTELAPRLVAALAAKQVVGVVAGAYHTAVWTDTGELFTFGQGEHGQLGQGGDQKLPRMVEALAGKKVVGAAAGTYHTAVWTEEGELFTFGKGERGMLGHGGQSDERVPRLMEALTGKKVIGAAAGGMHTVVWTEAGELFTFGHGLDGRLGHHGGTRDELAPRLVERLAGKKVVGAAAGTCHTAVWTEEGELFTFGHGRDGRLGHGGQNTEYAPRLVQAMAGKTVIGGSAGAYHTVVRTEAGELFTFGRGLDGRLGHGGQQDEFVPRLVGEPNPGQTPNHRPWGRWFPAPPGSAGHFDMAFE